MSVTATSIIRLLLLYVLTIGARERDNMEHPDMDKFRSFQNAKLLSHGNDDVTTEGNEIVTRVQ